MRTSCLQPLVSQVWRVALVQWRSSYFTSSLGGQRTLWMSGLCCSCTDFVFTRLFFHLALWSLYVMSSMSSYLLRHFGSIAWTPADKLIGSQVLSVYTKPLRITFKAAGVGFIGSEHFWLVWRQVAQSLKNTGSKSSSRKYCMKCVEKSVLITK